MQPLVQKTVEQQINDALLPRGDVERAALAVKVVPEPRRRTKVKTLSPQLFVNLRDSIEPASRQVIKRPAIGRDVQRLAPNKQRLSVDANRSLVEFRLAIKIAPAKQSRRFRCACHECEQSTTKQQLRQGWHAEIRNCSCAAFFRI